MRMNCFTTLALLVSFALHADGQEAIELRLAPQEYGAEVLALSGDGSTVFTRGSDFLPYRWDVANGEFNPLEIPVGGHRVAVLGATNDGSIAFGGMYRLDFPDFPESQPKAAIIWQGSEHTRITEANGTDLGPIRQVLGGEDQSIENLTLIGNDWIKLPNQPIDDFVRRTGRDITFTDGKYLEDGRFVALGYDWVSSRPLVYHQNEVFSLLSVNPGEKQESYAVFAEDGGHIGSTVNRPFGIGRATVDTAALWSATAIDDPSEVPKAFADNGIRNAARWDMSADASVVLTNAGLWFPEESSTVFTLPEVVRQHDWPVSAELEDFLPRYMSHNSQVFAGSVSDGLRERAAVIRLPEPLIIPEPTSIALLGICVATLILVQSRRPRC